MLAALLIRAGIPARARCGFASYFWPPEEHRWEDHWITEYWSASRRCWCQADAQLDALQQQQLRLDFDPRSLPAGKFLSASQVWTKCRADEMDPESFRWDPFSGLTLIRWNLIRDVACLNKVEALGWDHWGGMFPLEEASLGPEELAVYDGIATRCTEDGQLSALQARDRDDLRVRVPRTVWLMREVNGAYKTEASDFLAGRDDELALL